VCAYILDLFILRDDHEWNKCKRVQVLSVECSDGHIALKARPFHHEREPDKQTRTIYKAMHIGRIMKK